METSLYESPGALQDFELEGKLEFSIALLFYLRHMLCYLNLFTLNIYLFSYLTCFSLIWYGEIPVCVQNFELYFLFSFPLDTSPVMQKAGRCHGANFTWSHHSWNRK